MDAAIPCERKVRVAVEAVSTQQRDSIADKKIADMVLRIYVTQLVVEPTSDGTVAGGNATVFVRVHDRRGKGIWPVEAPGYQLTARVEQGLLADRDAQEIIKQLSTQLTQSIGHMFHSYPREGHESFTRPQQNPQ